MSTTGGDPPAQHRSHICNEWLSQIVLDKVHSRPESTQTLLTGGVPRHENGTSHAYEVVASRMIWIAGRRLRPALCRRYTIQPNSRDFALVPGPQF